MNKYTIFCSPEQTKKALELGAPIDTDNNPMFSDFIEVKKGLYAIAPTAEEMIGYLEEQGIAVDITNENSGCEWSVWVKKEHCANYSFIEENVEYYLSRKEATLDAIDVALKYLEKVHKKTNNYGNK